MVTKLKIPSGNKLNVSIKVCGMMFFILATILLDGYSHSYSQDLGTSAGSDRTNRQHRNNHHMVIDPAGLLVSADLDDVSMKWFFSKITELTDIHTKISDKAVLPPITLHSDRLPFDIMIKRVLKNTNHVIFYSIKETGLKITDIHILKHGEKRPLTSSLNHPHTSETEIRTLYRALESDAVPDDVKAALLHQSRSNNTEMKQEIEARRFIVVDHLIDWLEKNSATAPQTINQLRIRNKIQSTKN